MANCFIIVAHRYAGERTSAYSDKQRYSNASEIRVTKFERRSLVFRI